jgi:hypothetical protein
MVHRTVLQGVQGLPGDGPLRGQVLDRLEATYTLHSHRPCFFIIKLRRRFSIKIDSPGPGLVVLAPVSLSDYREAVSRSDNNLPGNPNIVASPDKPQQILTIGMIVTFIRQFIPKLKQAMAVVNYMLRSETDSFWSHFKAKFKMVRPGSEPAG